MIIEDFIMLGRTVPEESKKHGRVVCSAGYSRELRQFMRIYPLSPFERIQRWSICSLGIKRNSQDSRIESWRLRDDFTPHIVGKAKKENEFDFLKSLASGSIAELNESRASLGIICPKRIGWRFDGMKKNEEYLMSLFDDDIDAQIKRPRLQFSDDEGDHDHQLRDWGCHEFIRKQPPHKHCELWGALKLTDRSYEHILFVGNHNQHRNSWLVIGVVSERTKLQTDMFEEAA